MAGLVKPEQGSGEQVFPDYADVLALMREHGEQVSEGTALFVQSDAAFDDRRATSSPKDRARKRLAAALGIAPERVATTTSGKGKGKVRVSFVLLSEQDAATAGEIATGHARSDFIRALNPWTGEDA